MLSNLRSRRKSIHFAKEFIFFAMLLSVVFSQTALAVFNDWKPLLSQAKMQYKNKKYSEAENIAKQALQVAQVSPDGDYSGVGEIKHFLSRVYKKKKDYQKAMESSQEALNLYGFYHGKENIRTTHPMTLLADIYRLKGEYEKSEELFYKSLSIRQKIYGEMDVRVADNLNHLSRLYYSKKEYEKAEKFAGKSIHIMVNKLGREHRRLGQVVIGAGKANLKQGYYKHALISFKWALEISTKNYPSTHRNVIISKKYLGKAYRGMGDLDKAEVYFLQALSNGENSKQKDTETRLKILNELLSLYKEQGRTKSVAAINQKIDGIK